MGASIRDIAKAIGAPDAAEKWQPRIDEWEALYAGNRDTIDLTYLSGGTKRTPRTLNLGKSVAEDWAGLIWGEGATITAGAEDSPETQWLRVLIDHDDLVESAERMVASSIVALDWLLTGVVMDKRGAPVTASGLNLDITRAGDIIPLSWDKRTIREVALVSHDAQHVTVREHRVEDGRRVIVNRRFDVQGTAIAKEWPPEQLIGAGITPKLKLDLPYSEYPTFALAMPAIANNIDPDSPFTVSVLHAARDAIGVADDYFDNLGNDVELGRKMMLISEMLLRRDDDGNAIPPSRDRQSFFLMLPGSVDTEDPPLKEYNPDLRVDENERGINLALSLVSKAVGMGYGRYRMEGGALKTATEVISQNSDLYRTRKKHFRAFAASIETLARAALVLGREVMGVPVDPCIQIRVTSDDSVIEDDAAKRERARDAVNAGLMSKLRYLVEIEGLTEEAARVELEELSKDAPSFSLLD